MSQAAPTSAIIWVGTTPGQTALTRMPNWATSLASDWVKPTTANLDEE
jgi:hypothetical protein